MCYARCAGPRQTWHPLQGLFPATLHARILQPRVEEGSQMAATIGDLLLKAYVMQFDRYCPRVVTRMALNTGPPRLQADAVF
jgi:hypothetical protein